ncbi:MAG: IPT/TIG domain-containing protein [Cyanobacteria bacterium J06642_2]
MVMQTRSRQFFKVLIACGCLCVPLVIAACGDDDDNPPPVAVDPRVPPPAANFSVTGISPRFGVAGNEIEVTITGQNFPTDPRVIFSVDRPAARIVSSSATEIVAVTPDNVSAGVITVASATNSAASPIPFTPTIFSGEEPDLALIIDVSGSSSATFQGSPVGDLNQDGTDDTILDAEIAAYLTLNQELINLGLGNIADISVIPFSSDALVLDLDPTQDGIQAFAKPDQDSNGNGILDIEEAFRTLISEGSTNYEAALQLANTTLTSQPDTGTTPEEIRSNRNVIFLSDGEPTAGADAASEYGGSVDPLTALAENVRAFGVGTGATLPTLQVIDPNAQIFTTSDELLFVIRGGQLQN